MGLDITEMEGPGVFMVECIPEHRALFVERESNTFSEMIDYCDDLRDGVCENQELLEDFKKYGPDGFRPHLVISDYNLGDDDKRKQALRKAQEGWTGRLY